MSAKKGKMGDVISGIKKQAAVVVVSKRKQILMAIGSFFIKNGKFRPIRFFISIFIGLCITIVIQKMIAPSYYSDEFMRDVFAFTGVLIGADTWATSSKRKYENGGSNATQ